MRVSYIYNYIDEGRNMLTINIKYDTTLQRLMPACQVRVDESHIYFGNLRT